MGKESYSDVQKRVKRRIVYKKMDRAEEQDAGWNAQI